MEVNGWDVLTETTNVPMVTLTGLRERTNHMARVRGMCEWDTEYGAWSGWLDVYTGAHHDGPPQSIGNPGRFTQTMPNPARGKVTVLSGYRLSRVVVYDLKGNAVPEQEADTYPGLRQTSTGSLLPVSRGDGDGWRVSGLRTHPLPLRRNIHRTSAPPSQEDTYPGLRPPLSRGDGHFY